jgi:hypothetical protein
MIQRFFRNNGLTLALIAMFALAWLGQFATGYRVDNDHRRRHGEATITPLQYVTEGHFWQATGENWESEFLQMAMFVLLAVVLFQKGSPESHDPDDVHTDPTREDPHNHREDTRSPWPVRKGSKLVVWLYSHSLSITFLLLFLASMLIHAAGGVVEFNDERTSHGESPVPLWRYMVSDQFWFESFQNWQSEFLSLAAMVWLSVYLRERGSPESKPVHTPHDESGE